MPRPPIVKSFLMADSVIHDRITGKWSIIGIFDRVMASRYPTFHSPLAVMTLPQRSISLLT